MQNRYSLLLLMLAFMFNTNAQAQTFDALLTPKKRYNVFSDMKISLDLMYSQVKASGGVLPKSTFLQSTITVRTGNYHLGNWRWLGTFNYGDFILAGTSVSRRYAPVFSSNFGHHDITLNILANKSNVLSVGFNVGDYDYSNYVLVQNALTYLGYPSSSSAPSYGYGSFETEKSKRSGTYFAAGPTVMFSRILGKAGYANLMASYSYSVQNLGVDEKYYTPQSFVRLRAEFCSITRIIVGAEAIMMMGKDSDAAPKETASRFNLRIGYLFKLSGGTRRYAY